ncbi:MAG: UDP-N-acetylmuramoyl-L-alanyl-D-glutamate--2,6-diaminopimelate ligase [Acidobacteriota bacterium]
MLAVGAVRLVDALDGLVQPQTSAVLPPALAISGVAHDSRQVEPGDLFVALVGDRFDGRTFAADAAARGAVAVLGPGPPPEGLELPWVEHSEPRAILGELSARVFGHPQNAMTMIGVTGTNGKSTTVALVAAALEASGRPTAVFGTLGFRLRDQELTSSSSRTTPEAPELFRALRAAHRAGAAAVAMEVSSHALAQGRVDGLRFDVGVFTNLSHDHLDFHGSVESYFAAKRSLFERLRPGGRAVLGIDDGRLAILADELRGRGTDVLTFASGTASADVRALDASYSLDGVDGALVTPRGKHPLRSALRGPFNLRNLLAAAAVLEALDAGPQAFSALASVAPLPGRLQPVGPGEPPAFVDYAHTPAALEALLSAARAMSDRKIAIVFGCGGERDREKRPAMGEIAGRLADLAVATSDNPRGEDPLAILSAVEQGLRRSGNPTWRLIADRREAIRGAVQAALLGGARGERWLILVAGKGHEAVQDFGDRQVPFDDRREVEAAFAVATERVGGGRG